MGLFSREAPSRDDSDAQKRIAEDAQRRHEEMQRNKDYINNRDEYYRVMRETKREWEAIEKMKGRSEEEAHRLNDKYEKMIDSVEQSVTDFERFEKEELGMRGGE